MPPRMTSIVGVALAALFGACAISHASPDVTDGPSPDTEVFSIGSAATDTIGGYLPEGRTLSPFDTTNPVIGWLDPPLLTAIQDAARAAKDDGVDVQITSGWRTEGFQRRLFDDGVRLYGSAEAAAQYVASPEVSRHVAGKAVDVGPAPADMWLIRNGSRFGLCQIYANEIWHFELAAGSDGTCPPLKPNAAG